jgi:hypothetical protein
MNPLYSKINTLIANSDISADQEALLRKSLEGMTAPQLHRITFLIEAYPALLTNASELLAELESGQVQDVESAIEAHL